jgi:hypothetical protein
MIQEANIGVGLFGHEGSQAAMSADYAFGQFCFLTVSAPSSNAPPPYTLLTRALLVLPASSPRP